MSVISNIIKRIFGKKEESYQEKNELMRFSDQLIIPRMKEYKAQKSMYKKINEYKKKYSNILKQFMAGTRDFKNTEIYDELKMIISLTTQIFVNESDNLLNDTSELKNAINYAKYEIYMTEIEKLKNDLMCRLIALNELGKINGVPKRNFSLFSQELEHLSVGMLSFMLQQEAICIEKENIKTVLHYKIIDENEADNYYNKLLKTAIKVLPFEDINEIRRMKVNKVVQIAMLEKKIEEFFYKNPQYIKSIILRLKTIERKWNLRNLENLSNEVCELENDLNFYERYGGKVDNNSKEKLYLLKFNILANDYTIEKSSLFNSEDPLAYTIYEKEIFKRIELILNNSNPCLCELFEYNKDNFWENVIGKRELKKVNEVLKDIFSDHKGQFKTESILDNIYILQLLVALDSKDQLIEWFNRKVDRKDFLGEELNNKYFNNYTSITFSNNIPIESICYVILYSEEFNNSLPLVNFYSIIENKLFPRSFEDFDVSRTKIKKNYLPEGIEKIKIIDPTFHKSEDSEMSNEPFTKYLINKMYNKYVVFPKSLKSAAIEGDIFFGMEFQNGVESIKFSGLRIDIIIPPTVKELEIKSEPSEEFMASIGKGYSPEFFTPYLNKEIEYYCIAHGNSYIVFDNYKESLFLKEKKDLINDFIILLPNPCQFVIEFNDRNGERQRIFIDRKDEYDLASCFPHFPRLRGSYYLKKISTNEERINGFEDEIKKITDSISNSRDSNKVL